MRATWWIFGASALALVVGAGMLGRPSLGRDGGPDVRPPRPVAAEPERGQATGRAHATIANPAALSGARAEEVYQAIRANLIEDYAQSGDPVAIRYIGWLRYNRFPYRSARHGERFVNNYANDVAQAYGRFEEVGSLPPGSIVVKDSFWVSDRGAILTGPLFLMEKMPAGFAPADGDWRYMMIEADGTIAGLSGGIRAANVKFCAECHNKAPAASDHLYFMPEDARRR